MCKIPGEIQICNQNFKIYQVSIKLVTKILKKIK